MQATSLTREIEVSHWGNIYVEEQYELVSGLCAEGGTGGRKKLAVAYVSSLAKSSHLLLIAERQLGCCVRCTAAKNAKDNVMLGNMLLRGAK